MMYDIEVKVSLKPGMLNPEATTIQRSLALLGYVKLKEPKQKRSLLFVWKLTQKMTQEKKWMTCVKSYYAIQLSITT